MNKELKQKIDEAVANIASIGTEEGKAKSDRLMSEAFALAVTPEEKKEAGTYLRMAILNRKRTDVQPRTLLGDVADAVSLSYIAKEYFGKDRSWLYQRINGSTVNGKPAAFTQNELTVLAGSLKDLSQRLSEISQNIAACI